MSIDVKIPDIGKELFEVTDILVKVGDHINVDESIIILEGNKTSIEIPSLCSGIVKKIFIQKGDKVGSNSLVMVLSELNKDLNKNNKRNLDQKDGFQKEINSDLNNKEVSNYEFYQDEFHRTKSKSFYTSPLIRHLSRKFDIDITMVTGTGKKGRITKSDLFNYIKNSIKSFEKYKKLSKNSFYSGNSNIVKHKEDSFNILNTEKQFITKAQKKLGDHLHKSWINIPHVTIMDEIDITETEIFRKNKNKEISKYKMTILSFLVKVIFSILKEMPIFNSSISEDKTKIIIKKYINIGIAIDSPYGLFVPVIKNINEKGILDISKEISKISESIRLGKLSSVDMNNGTFTISSLGNIGSKSFTPIINFPEASILGVSRASFIPKWNETEFIPRYILPVSLSFDHRIINGADGARFIKRLSYLMSDIRSLNL